MRAPGLRPAAAAPNRWSRRLRRRVAVAPPRPASGTATPFPGYERLADQTWRWSMPAACRRRIALDPGHGVFRGALGVHG